MKSQKVYLCQCFSYPASNYKNDNMICKIQQNTLEESYQNLAQKMLVVLAM